MYPKPLVKVMQSGRELAQSVNLGATIILINKNVPEVDPGPSSSIVFDLVSVEFTNFASGSNTLKLFWP